MPTVTATITGLFIYPVKSLKGIALREAGLTPLGLENDRRWMIVQENGRFVTQREFPALARIRTGLTETGLVLSMEGMQPTRVPWNGRDGEPVSTRVWKDDCEAVDQGEEVGRWLTEALGGSMNLKLVAMRNGFVRSLHKAGVLGNETTTRFADAAPFLVTNEGSLDALNAELESRGLNPVPMNRFRPNIVISGLQPFSEHRTRALSNQACSFSLRYPCERCVVTTIDQQTGERDPDMQPFKTLADINPMPEKPRSPAFGENAVLTRGEGARLSVGDTLEQDL
jgi:uncharacterized protein YcbX